MSDWLTNPRQRHLQENLINRGSKCLALTAASIEPLFRKKQFFKEQFYAQIITHQGRFSHA